ncbi:MAG: right-handed parallel beta-helix repeat-containing protein [Sedimentisphaerales bacterium]|nr:right-handed parallel beta-helix repeat-containing protein [Sedimentisphaerales bacterium]
MSCRKSLILVSLLAGLAYGQGYMGDTDVNGVQPSTWGATWVQEPNDANAVANLQFTSWGWKWGRQTTDANALTDIGFSSWFQGRIADANEAAFALDVNAPTYNVRHYGATGDGATDDAAAIQLANDTAAAVGGVLVFPPGTYSIQSAVSVDASVDWRGYGATLLLDGGDITVAGTATAAEALTAEVDRGDPNVSVANESAFSGGDIVFLSGHASASYTTDNEAFWGEYHIVRGTDTNEVQLESVAANRLETATHYPAIKIVTPIRVRFYDLTIRGNDVPNSLVWYYTRDSGLYGCEITGDEGGGDRIVEVRDSWNFAVQDCTMYDVGVNTASYPVMAYRCDGMTFARNRVRNSEQSMTAQWSKNVVFVNNTLTYVHAAGLLAQNCFGVSITGNVVSNMPRTMADYEAAATSVNGIQIVGAENVAIVGNSLYSCHGEGAIYVRSSNYVYADGTYNPPCRNIAITGNVVIDANETSQGAANHTGCIYLKAAGSDIVVANNTLEFHSRTAASAAIMWAGEYERMTVCDNIIRTDQGGIYAKDYTGPLYPRGGMIRGNSIHFLTDIVASAAGAIRCATVSRGYDWYIQDNHVTGVPQTGNQWHVVASYVTTTWETERLWISGNTVEFESDAAGRGVYTVATAGTPDPQQVRVWGNDFSDLAGDDYSPNIEAYVHPSGTLILDDGTTEKLTMTFVGGNLTTRTVEATTGSALTDWTD